MKLAIVHEWLVFKGGAENTVEAMCMAFPKADIFTLVYEPKNYTDSIISKHRIQSSFIQKLPKATKFYKNYLPLFPLAIEQFDLRSYDLIISSHHSVSHGVISYPYQKHICYTYTPMRYLWWDYFGYINDPLLKNPIKRAIAKYFINKLRVWDIQASFHPDYYIAISNEIFRRIQKYYRRTPSTIIHCPVDFEQYVPKRTIEKDDYYYTISRMVPYKKIDLIVETFTKGKMNGSKLVVAGSGQEMSRIKKIAQGHINIEILGHDEGKVDLMQRAKACIFAAHEDFGIIPLEAQASGTPVIAFGKGGVLDTVIKGKTGIFFYEQTTDALIHAIKSFENIEFDKKVLIENAKRFSINSFIRNLRNFINNVLLKD